MSTGDGWVFREEAPGGDLCDHCGRRIHQGEEYYEHEDGRMMHVACYEYDGPAASQRAIAEENYGVKQGRDY